MTDFATTLTVPGTHDDLEVVGLEIFSRARREESVRSLQLAVKRALDITVAAAALLVLLPLLLLVAALVKLDSDGPIIFRQVRTGAGGRRFKILKFRTMVSDAEHVLDRNPELRAKYESNDFKLAVEDDPRITRIGRILRRTSLDELPQLWNVVRGEMSLVGARPIEPAQVPALYQDKAGTFLQMRPGLTGYWQISGRSQVASSERAALDLYYIRNWSVWLDLRILARTIPAVVSRRGAH